MSLHATSAVSYFVEDFENHENCVPQKLCARSIYKLL